MELRNSISFFAVLIVSTALLIGCNSASSPTSSSGSTPPGPTSTPTSTAPIVIALVAQVNPNAVVYVSNSAGTTGIAGAAVTMINQGVSTTMSYLGQNTPKAYLYNVNSNFGFPTTISGDYFYAQPTLANGQVYQFDVSAGGTLYSSSVTYISDSNGNVAVVSGTGIQCTWTPGITNRNFVSIFTSSSPGASMVTQIGPPLSSEPCTILNSAFSNEASPGSGTDELILFLTQIQNGAFPGSNPQSAAGSINWALISAY